MAKKVQEEVLKQTGKLIKYAGTRISSKVAPQLARLSETLKVETISQFVKDLSPATRALKFSIRTSNFVAAPTSPVNVARSRNLSQQEKLFVHNRLKKIQPILAKEFEITQPLRMAFCCSGGGNRAMIGTMGIFQAAVKAKIFQASMYMAGLSGSTWLIGPWSYLYLQGKLHKDLEVSLQQMVQNWSTVLNDKDMVSIGGGKHTPACLKGDQATTFSRQVAIRLAYDLPISAVDLYGAMVGNFALDMVGEDKLKITWSSIAQKLQMGDIPLPLCSAVFDDGSPSPKKNKEHKQYAWFEFSPFEFGSVDLGPGYILPQYLGSRFVQGKLDTTPGQVCPEYPLNFMLGVCGSAFSISLDDAIDKKLRNAIFTVGSSEVIMPIDTWVRSLLDESTGPDTRGKRNDTLHARFSNFSNDLPTSILKNEETFGLLDAGINFNFPIPLLLDRPERKVDIIFIYDSNPVDEATFIEAAAYYKRKKTIAVPDMSKVKQKALMAHVMTVFNDPRKKDYDAKSPTIIYFPTRGFDISNPPYVTTNFKYTEEQMEKLITAMDDAFTSQVPDIKKIMQLVAKARHR
jgi:cytosolic phospholipase A2